MIWIWIFRSDPHMKTCFKCGKSAPLTEFYKHPNMSDGHLSKCKDCTKADVIANRRNKAEYYRLYDRLRCMNPDRVAARSAYAASIAGVEARKASAARWKERNREKRKAHNALNNAVRAGVIKKPSSCSNCGATGNLHGHHDDHGRPLEVRWLCPQCHSDIHRKYNDYRETV